MFHELRDSRELAWRMFARDFSANYRQSVLGYLWSVMPAVATAAIFTYLNKARVISTADTGMPYTVYVLLGLTVWQLFSVGLSNATMCVEWNHHLVAKISFPRETLIWASFGPCLFDFAIRWMLVLIACFLFHAKPSWTFFLIPLVVAPMALLTLGLGMLWASINSIMRDASQFLHVILTFWMFLTPVVYPPPKTGLQAMINYVNPVSPFVIAAHDMTLRGHFSQPIGYAIGCVMGVIVFLVGWRVFHLCEPIMAERL